MVSLLETDGAAGFFGAVVCHVVCHFTTQRMHTLRRASQIRMAADLLRDHYAALDEFLSDPAAPDSMCDMLVFFSDASSDKKSGHQIARMIREGDAAARTEFS